MGDPWPRLWRADELMCLSAFHRREDLPQESMRNLWEQFALDPVVLYAPEDLMARAVEIALETQAIIYDALFLALAKPFLSCEVGTVN